MPKPNSKPRPGSIQFHPLAESQPGSAFPVDRELIKRLEFSFALLKPETTEFATRFYNAAFAAYPQLRGMFPSDMSAQNVKLIKSLEMVIDGLKHPEMVRARLKELGAVHTAKGVKPEHYPIVCKFMVQTMSEMVGTRWNPQLQQDWTSALDQVSRLMMG